MSEFYLPAAHDRLVVWGEWTRANRLGGSGDNILARLISGKVGGGTDSAEFPHELQRTDRAVACLRRDYRQKDWRLKDSVFRHYVGFEPLHMIGRKYGVDSRKAGLILWNAQCLIAGYLRENYPIFNLCGR